MRGKELRPVYVGKPNLLRAARMLCEPEARKNGLEVVAVTVTHKDGTKEEWRK